MATGEGRRLVLAERPGSRTLPDLPLTNAISTTMRPRLLLCAFLLLLAGCDLLGLGGSGEITLTTAEDVYAPGEVVGLRVKNGTSQTIGFNLCAAEIEYRVEGQWSPATEDEVICLDILYTLKPGKTFTDFRQLSERLPGGTYRIRDTFSGESGDDGPFMVASNAFAVRR